MCRISGDKKSLLKIYHYSDFLLPTSRWTLFLPVSFESRKRERKNRLTKETDRLEYTRLLFLTKQCTVRFWQWAESRIWSEQILQLVAHCPNRPVGGKVGLGSLQSRLGGLNFRTSGFLGFLMLKQYRVNIRAPRSYTNVKSMLLEATSHYHAFISKILPNVAKTEKWRLFVCRAHKTINHFLLANIFCTKIEIPFRRPLIVFPSCFQWLFEQIIARITKSIRKSVEKNVFNW